MNDSPPLDFSEGLPPPEPVSVHRHKVEGVWVYLKSSASKMIGYKRVLVLSVRIEIGPGNCVSALSPADLQE